MATAPGPGVRSRRLLSVAAVLTLLGCLASATVVGPVEASDGAPPACDGVYQDVLATNDALGDWDSTVVGTIFIVPRTYRPGDLVATGLPGGQQVRRLVVADLRAMAHAASKAGAPLQVVSAYRSYSTHIACARSSCCQVCSTRSPAHTAAADEPLPIEIASAMSSTSQAYSDQSMRAGALTWNVFNTGIKGLV